VHTARTARPHARTARTLRQDCLHMRYAAELLHTRYANRQHSA
jgi:hypothetical protein